MMLVLLMLLTAEPEPEPEPDPEPESSSSFERSIGLPLAAGATLQPSVAGISGRFFFAFRPELALHPWGKRGLGFGPYLLAATLRSFTDFAGGGGLSLTPPFPFALRPVLSAGALATHDARGWAPCLEAGLFFGVHSGADEMAVAGLRADVHVWLQGEPRWSLSLSLAYDLEWPIQLVRILTSSWG